MTRPTSVRHTAPLQEVTEARGQQAAVVLLVVAQRYLAAGTTTGAIK